MRPSGLRITVTDNGTGIGQAILDRIFEPFFTTKEIGSGTGLGLSVSFGIVTSMGGRLEARDVLPRGAEFAITLPLVMAAPATADGLEPPAMSEEESHSLAVRRHVLVVDDEVQAVEAMSSCLNEFGYRISQANSGNAAFRIHETDPADIVVTDLRMPDGNGEDLIKRLRRVSPTLPVIVVTGHIGATECLAEGADQSLAVMKKPVSLIALTETIEQLLIVR